MTYPNSNATKLEVPGNDASLSPQAAQYSARGDKQGTTAGSTHGATGAGKVADLGAPGDGGSLSPRAENYSARGDKQGQRASNTSGATHAPRGWQSKLARHLNLDRRKVNDVLLGKRTNARVAAAIANAIGMPASQLWPGKYQRLEYFEKVARHQPTKTQTARHADACSATGSPE